MQNSGTVIWAKLIPAITNSENKSTGFGFFIKDNTCYTVWYNFRTTF